MCWAKALIVPDEEIIFIHITHMTKLAICLMEVSNLRTIDGNIDRFSKTLYCTELLHFSPSDNQIPRERKSKPEKVEPFLHFPLILSSCH